MRERMRERGEMSYRLRTLDFCDGFFLDSNENLLLLGKSLCEKREGGGERSRGMGEMVDKDRLLVTFW
jgi:hypothetical protein